MKTNRKLSPDKPLENPEQDLLGYAPFARHLANSITEMTPDEGLTVAIYGNWGTGKSSVLNFTTSYITEKEKRKKIENKTIIVHFNPWWFSGSYNLTIDFLNQLRAVLGSKELKTRKIAELVGGFSEVISKIPLPHFELALIIKGLAEYFKPKADIYSQKEKVIKALRESNKRILVIIDDVDRLTSSEIRQLFQAIKAIANFPNIIYLLALDKDRAISAITEQYNDDRTEIQRSQGEKYLEKIVQVSFELPIPDEISLNRIFRENLTSIIGKNSNFYSDKIYNDAFENALAFGLKTPRDIAILSNSLLINYPVLKGEVHLGDFVLIEFLRVFYPSAYDFVRKNPNLFYGSAYDEQEKPFVSKSIESTFAALHNQLSKQQRTLVDSILFILFPKYGILSGNKDSATGGQLIKGWRRELRICSSDSFYTYFRLSVPFWIVSDSEIKKLLSYQNDYDKYSAYIVELVDKLLPFNNSSVKDVLERIKLFTDGIENESIGNVIKALMDLSDELVRRDKEIVTHLNMQIIGNLLNIFSSLLDRINIEERSEFLFKIIDDSPSITTPLMCINMLEKNRVAHKENKNFLGLDFDRLVLKAREKAQKAIDDHSIFEAPYFPTIISRFADEPMRKKVWNYFSGLSDKEMLEHLTSYFNLETKSYNTGYLEVVFENTREYEKRYKSMLDNIRDILRNEKETIAFDTLNKASLDIWQK